LAVVPIRSWEDLPDVVPEAADPYPQLEDLPAGWREVAVPYPSPEDLPDVDRAVPDLDPGFV
jgi:hypothetical protein